MSSTLTVRKRQAFSVIPDYILKDTRMRTETRLVLGYLVGRPDGWEVRPAQIQRTLGISRDRWSKAKQEMEQFGYLRQTRRRKPDGTFEWEHIVSDTPSIEDGTTAGKPCNGETGETSAGKSGTGLSGAGEPSNITTPSNQEDLNTPSPYPFPESVAITQACRDEATERFQGYSIEFLMEEWLEAVQRRGETLRSPDKAFLAWAAVYANNHPLPFGGAF